MKKIFTILLLFSFGKSFSQTFKEKELKTEIKEVTVFLSAAQIFESGNTLIPAGRSILTIKNLSPFLDEKSIQVKAEGDFIILSVNHKFNYLTELKKDEKIDSLRKIVDAIEATTVQENARLDVLREKQSVLNENKKLGGTSGSTVAQLKQAVDYYDVENSRIRDEEIKTRRIIELKKKEQGKLEHQLKELNAQRTMPSSEIDIRVSADSQINGKFKVTYIVSNAGWYPKYDIRVHNIKLPLELTYKAEVFQNTGVDWKNVKLRFSNGDPNQSGVVPELRQWNLNYARYTIFDKSGYGSLAGQVRSVRGKVISAEDGMSVPGVNVVVKGTTVGTVTDAEGNYSLTLPNEGTTLLFSFIGMTTHEEVINRAEINASLAADVKQLQEVVVSAYGAGASDQSYIRIRGQSSSFAKERAIITRFIENQTTVEIEVETPYSIKSNGEKLQVDLRKHEVQALYEYYSIPKLDKDAFLIARIINWDQYNLLEGEANLYFEDAYVGRSVLNAKALKDTLNISLGRDKNIIVGREKNEQFSKTRTLGGNTTETRGFKIIARNKKSQPIKLTIFDQIPVSVISDITVNTVELTNGLLDEKTGKIAWELTIDPQQQKTINLQYEVKYPKREKVILE